MNTNLRTKNKITFLKTFFKLINNTVFRKNLRKQRDIKLVTTERINYQVPEPNYHATKFFTENLLATEKNTDFHK